MLSTLNVVHNCTPRTRELRQGDYKLKDSMDNVAKTMCQKQMKAMHGGYTFNIPKTQEAETGGSL